MSTPPLLSRRVVPVGLVPPLMVTVKARTCGLQLTCRLPLPTLSSRAARSGLSHIGPWAPKSSTPPAGAGALRGRVVADLAGRGQHQALPGYARSWRHEHCDIATVTRSRLPSTGPNNAPSWELGLCVDTRIQGKFPPSRCPVPGRAGRCSPTTARARQGPGTGGREWVWRGIGGDQVTHVTSAAMLAAVDLHLIGGIRVAFQARRTLHQQLTGQRPGGVIQPRTAAEVQHAQGLGTSVAGFVDQQAAALHVDTHFDEKIRGRSALDRT
ncbi:hypothetical protein L1887_57435 [Cichorium endivia]|nr:hypothetical protein L1887_57435 [Cichorium endivia]